MVPVLTSLAALWEAQGAMRTDQHRRGIKNADPKAGFASLAKRPQRHGCSNAFSAGVGNRGDIVEASAAA